MQMKMRMNKPGNNTPTLSDSECYQGRDGRHGNRRDRSYDRAALQDRNGLYDREFDRIRSRSKRRGKRAIV